MYISRKVQYSAACRSITGDATPKYTIAGSKILESETEVKSHTLRSLEDVKRQIRLELSRVLKKVSATVTLMCKTEKAAWLKLDDLEEECQRLQQQVNTAADNMVLYSEIY